VRTVTGPDPMQAGQAARALGIRTDTLARWRRNGRIAGTKRDNGRWEYARAEVERVLNGGAK
jgi:predicted site-specific integrase-resolvase